MLRSSALAVAVAVALLGASGAYAQNRDGDPRHTAGSTGAQSPLDPSRPWQFWAKGQGLNFWNFFEAPEGRPHETVQAVVGEVGASARISATAPLRAYGDFNYFHFNDDRLGASPGGRIGLRLDGRPHSFDVYAEELRNRPSLEIGDHFDRANIRNIVGEYSYRFARDWQVSAGGEQQNQNVKVTSSRDNDFRALGASLRWRGSRLFSPEIGFRKGSRDVNDATLSYDQDEVYLQVRSAPVPPLYLSVRLRDRTRDYTTGATTSSEFGRRDKRRSVTVSADWSVSKALTWDLYATREHVDVNRAGRDFTTSFVLLGLTWRW